MPKLPLVRDQLHLVTMELLLLLLAIGLITPLSASGSYKSKLLSELFGVSRFHNLQSPYTPCPFYKYTKLCKYKYNLINFRRQISTFSYTFLVNFAPLNQQLPMEFIIFVKLKHTQLSIERQN